MPSSDRSKRGNPISSENSAHLKLEVTGPLAASFITVQNVEFPGAVELKFSQGIVKLHTTSGIFIESVKRTKAGHCLISMTLSKPSPKP